jgi:predicted RNA binding protein YcfA (HicA-like mRNA interferase family)
MTPRIPTYSATEIIVKLQKLGFVIQARGATSHIRLHHSDGRKVTVPMHKGMDVGRGLLRKIIRDAKITPDEFANL